MKQKEIDLIVERVGLLWGEEVRTEIRKLKPQLDGIENGLERLQGIVERLDGIQSSQLRVIQASLEQLGHDHKHNITGIHSCLERLDGILEARATKALQAEDISRMMDATKPMLSTIMEATKPKSLSDQVDEIKALCDKLNLTIVQKE